MSRRMKAWLLTIAVMATLFVGAVLGTYKMNRWYEAKQSEVKECVQNMDTNIISFPAPNPVQADFVDSTAYFSRSEVVQFAQEATRTLVVIKTNAHGTISEVWAYYEIPGATTPYGAQILTGAPKGKRHWYSYRVTAVILKANSLEFVYKPTYSIWYSTWGTILTIPCVIVCLALFLMLGICIAEVFRKPKSAADTP